MPNNNTPRTNQNTNYQTQIDKVESLQGLVVEDGTIVDNEGTYYVSSGGDWYPFAPLTPNTLEIGWARYNDTQYTALSPKNFTTATFYVPNNAGTEIDNYNLNAYNGTEFTLEEGCTYSLTIAFKAHINTNNGHIELNMICPTDNDYLRLSDIIIFPKGNGVAHSYSRVFNFYVNTNAAASGLKMQMKASHAGSIYSVIYFIEKTCHA